MATKLTEEFVSEYIASHQNELISSYVNSITPITIRCKCGQIYCRAFERFKHNKVKSCGNCNSSTRHSRTHSYQHVQQYVSDQGCRLLSTSYQSQHDVLTIQCGCGQRFDRTFQHFKQLKRNVCSVCSGKSVKWTTASVNAYLSSLNSELVTDKFTGVAHIHQFKCNTCSEPFSTRFDDLKRSRHPGSCQSCTYDQNKNIRLNPQLVSDYISQRGCVLLSTYNNISTQLQIRCRCNRVYKQSFGVFRSRPHPECPRCSVIRTHNLSHGQLDKLSDSAYLSNANETKTLHEIAGDIGVSLQTVCNYFHKLKIPITRHNQSRGERELALKLTDMELNVELGQRNIIPPYELDLYLPDHKLAIEYCGLYWHSDQVQHDIQYHKRKHDMCKEMNIQLFTLFEDEWEHNSQAVIKKITNAVGLDVKSLYARNTVISEISSKTAATFLDKYHIQRSGSGSIRYGLYHGRELVAVMLFSKLNKMTGSYTLTRYASSQRVVGGFSKLLKKFERSHAWTNIVSFADQRWSNGKLYFSCGFELDKIIPPDYYYVKGLTRYHKFNFRHSKIAHRFTNYDSMLSESQNCKMNGYSKLWDCGKMKFVRTNRNIHDK